MKDAIGISGYGYSNAALGHEHAYLLPAVQSVLKNHFSTNTRPDKRIFDLGCGNGSVALYFAKLGYAVTGVDPSTSGIAVANSQSPELALSVGSAYDNLASKFGSFPLVMSLEVVEHVYAPRDYAKTVCELTESGGLAVISTPYHSYFKNLSLAISGKMDSHFTALWDHGHIKFWSVKTLSALFAEQGMVLEDVKRVGRFPLLAKSMILVFRKK
jgi:2-polyprenyl-3-methyl-5-hydroxy-6-metoxy-1,4-benzoquinol methylase